jgi:hypothetical protein
MAFWNSISPDESRQTVRANASVDVTVVPGQGATYDPDMIVEALAGSAILPDELPLRGECELTDPYESENSGPIGIQQNCQFGIIQYWVYETDADARDFVLYGRVGEAPVLVKHSQYLTDVFTGDAGMNRFVVAVGNVVVQGFTPLDYLDYSESEIAKMDTPRYAANLAEIGIDRLIRVAGYAP